MPEVIPQTVTVEALGALTFSEDVMTRERPACLLEAGEYPDKALSLTQADLDGIVSRFTAGLPVKVEHVDSPLDPLGRVCRIWREGSCLLGVLAFPEDLDSFLRRRGAAKLSVGLSRDPLALLEVSLVLKPRVASAALMGAEDGSTDNLNLEIVRLRAALTAREVESQVLAFKAQGRIVPASEAAARALLGSGERVVQMSGVREPVAAVFQRFLDAQPPVVMLGETVPTGGSLSGFTHYEHTFLSRLGVDPAKVAALINDEQKETSHAY